MSPIVNVLSPNVKTAEEYKRVRKQLRENALNYMDRCEHDATIFSEDEFNNVTNAPLIYQDFVRVAFRNGRGLFMSLEEIKSELWRFHKIDETVKSLLDSGILKEVYMEWPPKETTLCPFCGKPSAYPIKKKRLFFNKISAWSCANERCHMYREHYLL